MDVLRDPTQSSYSRLVGVGYLAIAVFGFFAILYVPSQIIADDPGETLSNIRQNRGLFNAGIAADSLVMLIEIMVSTMLYQMFRRVNETMAFAAMLARFAMVAVMAVMLLFQAGLAGMSSGAIPADDRLAEMLIHMHHAGVWVWQVFFGLHLILLGQLVCRTRGLPNIFAIGLTVGAFGYITDSIYSFGYPEAELLGWVRAVLLGIVTLSEIGFLLWLLIRAPRIGATETDV